MEQKELIGKFFENGAIAIVGATDNKSKFGSTAFKELKQKGFNVVPVNPKKEFIQGDKCFASVKLLPKEIKTSLFIIPPAETNKVVKEISSSGIKLIWMQQGSESGEAITFCKEHGIDVVSKKCVLMYAPPVKAFHKFHRTIWKIFGKL